MRFWNSFSRSWSGHCRGAIHWLFAAWGEAMQIKWLDDLLAVAEWKNFSRAAEVRCVTQSALSRRMKSMEEWVGAGWWIAAPIRSSSRLPGVHSVKRAARHWRG